MIPTLEFADARNARLGNVLRRGKLIVAEQRLTRALGMSPGNRDLRRRLEAAEAAVARRATPEG